MSPDTTPIDRSTDRGIGGNYFVTFYSNARCNYTDNGRNGQNFNSHKRGNLSVLDH